MYTEKASLSQFGSLKKRTLACCTFPAPVPLSISAKRFVVLGDGRVPKTCFFVRDTPTFDTHYKGDIKHQKGETIPIKIIDTAGQENFVALRYLSMREGDIVLIIFSATQFRSLRFADELVE
jgi:GTPase SAR1 family protein